MTALPYHKRYHSDALAGFMSLSLEERGAYQTLLDMIYDRGGSIPDNERLLAGYMQCSIRKWRSLRESLIAKGKIRVAANGNLTNDRAEKEIENSSKTSRKHAENGSSGGRKRVENEKKPNKNNDSDQARLEQGLSHTRSQKLEDRLSSIPAPARATMPPADPTLDRVRLAAGMSQPPRDARRLQTWLQAGADLEHDILPVVERTTARLSQRGDKPQSFKLFEDDVMTAARNRQAEGDAELRKYREITERYAHLPRTEIHP